MSHLTRCQASLLAALLDADGALMPYAELGDVVGSLGVNDSVTVRSHVLRIRRQGIACIEVVTGRGCRLTAVPPDWTLETVLAVLDAMRRDGYGRRVLLRRAS